MSHRNRYLCGVPTTKCKGAITFVGGREAALSITKAHSSMKAHGSHEEAYNCMKVHLLSQGYKRLSKREFLTPTGSVRIIPKLSQFGCELRQGKSESGVGKRVMFTHHQGHIIV